MVYKACVVPFCKSNSVSTPNKIFIAIPPNLERQKEWAVAMKTDKISTCKFRRHCCGDHFDLQNDLKNYIRYKLMGGRIYIKEGVVPHIFDCQQDSNQVDTTQDRSLAISQGEQDIIQNIVKQNAPSKSEIPASIPSFFESLASSMEYQQFSPTVTQEKLKYAHVAVQARPYFRSRYITCNLDTNIINYIGFSPTKISTTRDVNTSPIMPKTPKKRKKNKKKRKKNI